MKHLQKFEGFFNFLKGEKKKDNIDSESEFKEKIVTLDDSRYRASKRSKNGLYHIYDTTEKDWEKIKRGNNIIASVKEVDGNMILTIYSDYDSSIKGSKVKVKSVEQALRYMEKLKKEEEKEREELSKKFDKDISEEEY
jgi:hypothetical protein